MSDDFTPYANLLPDQLKAPIHNKAELDKICDFHADNLKLPLEEDRVAFFQALATVETNFAYFNVPRYEPAYGPGGIYYQKSEILKTAYEEWGALVACSYGPFQIMYVLARELGFPEKLSPLNLWSGFVSAPYVVEYLNECVTYGAKTVDALAAGYNGGKGAILKPTRWPQAYVKKFRKQYDRLRRPPTA